jgi:glutathione S-transferase
METAGKPLGQSNDPVRLSYQQPSGVRCDRSAIKTSHNFATADRCESKRVCVTLCRHRGGSSDQAKVAVAKQLSLIRRLDAPSLCEKCGLENVVRLSILHPLWDTPDGWIFADTDGRPLTVRATAYDICMRRIARHSPDYTGKVTVPVLRDHRSRRIVSDESLEIAQMQDDAFDEICGDRCFDLSPARLKPAMDELNTRIARSLSVAVYAVAGARNQQEYEAAMDELFDFLDDLDRQLEDGRPFLLGDRPTLADVPVHTPLVRFDVVYNSLSGRAAGD